MATSEKIQLKGAAQYKKDLQQIAAESKALASEMKLVKSSFDKSTTAEEKNEKVGAQLSKQIENQKKYVDKLTQAYEAEVKASGEQSTAALQAKDALNKAKTVLNDMERENNELADAENKEKVAVEKNTEAHERWKAVGKAAAASIAAVAAAAAAAAKAIWDATKASGEWADNILMLSQQTNVSTDTLQKWDYAARFIDTDTETMTKALAKVVKQQGSAIKTGKDYVETLDGQKIALKDANGEYKTSETLFYEMVDSLGKIADETTREAAAQELFGKSFQEMMPLINAGSEGLKKYGDEAEELGLILSGDAVNSLGEFDDQMQRLKATTETAARELALSFLPATQDIAKSLTDLASTVTRALADGFQEADADVILDALFEKLSTGLNKIETIMPAIATFVSGLINKMVTFVTQNLPMLVQVALKILTSLANGLIQNLPVLIPAIVQCVLTIVQTLTDPSNIGMLIDCAISLIKGLGNGLIKALPIIVAMAPRIVTNLVQSLILQGAKMYSAATQLVTKLTSGISAGMSALYSKVKTWVDTKIISPIKSTVSKFTSIGKSMVEGIWNGISDKMSWIKNKIKTWVSNVISWFKSYLGIHSPSKVMAGLGEEMSEGLAVGITDGMGFVKNALGATMGLVTADASPYGMGGVNVYIDGIKYNTDDYVDSSITNFVENMVRRGAMYGRA